MGADHARIVVEDLPGAVLQVVCDVSGERARAVAEECGAVDVATDPFAVIARSDVDAVLIASPDDTHAKLSIAAIQADKPVLCEKPLALTTSDCLNVIQAEKNAGRRMIQVGFMRRFDPSYTKMKADIESGVVGQPIMMHNFHRNVKAPAGFTGSMSITNSASHEFDVARFVLNTEYSTISAFQPEIIESDQCTAQVFLVLETTARHLVNVEVNNNATYGYDVRSELVGEKGSVFLNAPNHGRINTALTAIEHYPADWRPRFAEAYRLQNKSWLEFVDTGEPSPIAASAWDGYCATAVAEAGVKALTEGRKIAIDLVEKPSLY